MGLPPTCIVLAAAGNILRACSDMWARARSVSAVVRSGWIVGNFVQVSQHGTQGGRHPAPPLELLLGFSEEDTKTTTFRLLLDNCGSSFRAPGMFIVVFTLLFPHWN